MKNAVLFSALFLVAQTSFAFYADQLDKDICPRPEVSNSTLDCRRMSNELQTATKEKTTITADQIDKEAGNYPISVMDMGLIPEDSTDYKYGKFYRLISRSGKIVGYIVFEGYLNHETEEFMKFTVIYNARGELVRVIENS